MSSILLIASSDPTWLRFNRYHLEMTGFRVVEAGTGKSVFSTLQFSRPHLLLLDCNLSDLHPLALTRAIRANDMYNAFPIMLSGRGMSMEDRLQALEAGADVCLDEEALPGEIAARIRALLRRVTQPVQSCV